jgi:hypothetical protein
MDIRVDHEFDMAGHVGRALIIGERVCAGRANIPIAEPASQILAWAWAAILQDDIFASACLSACLRARLRPNWVVFDHKTSNLSHALCMQYGKIAES